MTDEARPYPRIAEAIVDGRTDEVAQLFGRFPDMETLDVPSFGTWLHYAAAQGTAEMVLWLIEKGFDPESTSHREGSAPLEYAAVNGRAGNVRLLLDLNVPLDTTTAIRNPLFGSILSRSTAIARMLLEAGIDTAPRYILGSVERSVDAVAFAMLQGATEIAHVIALHQHNGDQDAASRAMAEGLEIAHAITVPVRDEA